MILESARIINSNQKETVNRALQNSIDNVFSSALYKKTNVKKRRENK